MQFSTNLYEDGYITGRSDVSRYDLGTKKIHTVELIHHNDSKSNEIICGDLSIFSFKNKPEEIYFRNNKSDANGTYNVKTKKIDGGYYHMEDEIKDMLKFIFKGKEPTNINQLYEDMNGNVQRILQEINL